MLAGQAQVPPSAPVAAICEVKPPLSGLFSAVATFDQPSVWHCRQDSPKWPPTQPSILRCRADSWAVPCHGVKKSGARPPTGSTAPRPGVKYVLALAEWQVAQERFAVFMMPRYVPA